MATALTFEQLVQRLADLHQASLELVQDMSLDSLLERIADLAKQQAGSRFAAVGVVDEAGKLVKFIHVGITDDEVAQILHPPRGLGLIGALAASDRTIRIPQIENDPRSAGFPPKHPRMTSFLGVPIRLGEKHLGQIYLTDKIDAPEFTPDDQQVIEMLATYAAVAINNARLYTQLAERESTLTRRNENLALLNDLAPILVSSMDIPDVLDKGLTQVMEYLGMKVSVVYLRQEDGRTLKQVYHRGELPCAWQQPIYAVGDGLIGKTIETASPQLITLEQNCPEGNAGLIGEDGLLQAACFPLSGRLGVLGALGVATNNPLPMDELEMQFLHAISMWMGMSIENVRLNTQQRRIAVLEERERIGMDLHDGVIQSIYAVGLTLEHARLLLSEDTHQARQRIDQAVIDLNSTIRDIRAYILDLRPRQLHDESLEQGIQRLVTEFKANSLVDVNLKLPNDGLMNKLADVQSVAMFHICQEALANVAKHARARRVSVALWSTPERTLLEISDDGKGFDPEKVRLTLGHGLANMQTRARNVGGDIEFSSEQGNGTTILVWMPLST
ncbi:MAG: GAF domain-containing sensor histidine kinase [Anaerolineae bacterium]|nr:GAF domain-containing sensor histidine kinase [Anaerolineae bacterium]